MKYNIKIIGKGKHLPTQKISSIELEKRLSLNEGTIEQNFGVKNRYWVTEGESNSSMGALALKNALSDAGLVFKDLDILLNASATYDYPLPTTASFIQKELGESESGVPAFDINSSCISFLSGLEIASNFIHSGAYKRIGIVSSEISSRGLNINNTETFSLFGDGAVAFILEKSDGKSNCANFKFNTYSEGAFYTSIKGGGNVMHHHHPEANKHSDDFYFKMEGSKVLRFTINKLNDFLFKYMNENGIKINEYQHIIPHQASKLGLQFLKKKHNLSSKQLHGSLSKYGNTIAASIPITLYDAINEKKINRGEKIFLVGTAAGITIGATELTY